MIKNKIHYHSLLDRRDMVAPPNLPADKIFRRLLSSTEKLVEEKAIEDWKVHQVKSI